MIELFSSLADRVSTLASTPLNPQVEAALTACGIAGAALYLAGFALLLTGRLSGTGILYPASNTVAALLVLSSLSVSFNAGAFIIQISFAAIGAASVLMKLRARRLETR